MRSWIVLAVLGSLCAFAHAQCDISGAKENKPFPDIEGEAYESFMLGVEYTLPDASQTDYYVEYYDILNRMGRVEAYQDGRTLTYIYTAETYEAWDIEGWNCTAKFLNNTPEMLHDVQDDWLYINGEEGKQSLTVRGPSAMLKVAFDEYNKTKNPRIFYMGDYPSTVRGIKGVYWRRCRDDNTYVDYVFTNDKYENPYGLKEFKTLPLRVSFNGKSSTEDKALSTQQFDIVLFQPFISEGLRPFDLPRGRGCRRMRDVSDDDDIPKPPDFANKNLDFNAEVIYQTVDFNGEKSEFVTYYNTLHMTLDVRSKLLAYHYAEWNSSAPKSDPDVKPPVYTIFDMMHGYLYKYNLAENQCELSRQRSFVPVFQLPRGRGGIALTDPQVLYPNDEAVFLSEGVNRGLRVNVFEQVAYDYELDAEKGGFIDIPKAIITHSYLQDDEVERNINSVKNALTQVQMIFIGRLQKRLMEVVRFNFYGFSTEIRNREEAFNVKRCYKNDNDYIWLTLTFNADESMLNKIKQDVPSIESNVLNSIVENSELNAARIPIIEVDFSDALYVTMQILSRPPVLLDFVLPPENHKKITGTQEQEGITDEDDCATKCLESEGVCWGFSMCGAVCTFGADSGAKVEDTKEDCKLYRRDNGTFIPSTDLMVENIRRQVSDGMLKLVLKDKDDKMIQLEASSIDVTNPGEDDQLFEKIGNVLNPRMKVTKVGYKLKGTAGSTIKNMGRLRYDECQRICLDYRDCETVSYCLKGSECILSKTYGGDLAATDMEENNLCNVITRKYADNFNRSPGNVLNVGAQEILALSNVEDCAKACISKTGYKCLSFDHCPTEEKEACFLHTVHYPNPKDREKVSKRSTNCGHYVRKFSTEFKKNPEKRTVGAKLPPMTNLTLEDCARECMEYGKGTCFGYDFCQGSTILATSCILLDTDPNKMQLATSPICNNYFRTEIQSGPARPYNNGYAGGIGFLCFLVGGVVGALIVFGIAYLRVNRS